MKIGLEYDNADTIKLGLYLEKNNAYGTMYIALDVHEYANALDMMSNSSNNKLRLLYALGALSTLSSYSYDASIINIYKREVSVEALKFFSPNYYLNLASLVSSEYLYEAVKEEGSSSESNISRIKNIISSVQTLDAYRKSNDPAYTIKYNGTLSTEFLIIALNAKIDIGEIPVIGTEDFEKDNEDENKDDTNENKDNTNSGGEEADDSTEIKNPDGTIIVSKDTQKAITKTKTTAEKIMAAAAKLLPGIYDMINQIYKAIKITDNLLDSKGALFTRVNNEKKKADTDYGNQMANVILSFVDGINAASSSGAFIKPEYNVRNFIDWSKEVSKYIYADSQNLGFLYIVQEIAINMCDTLNTPLNNDIEELTISIFNYVFNRIYSSGFFSTGTVSNYYKEVFADRRNFYETYGVSIKKNLDAQYISTTLTNEFPALNVVNSYSMMEIAENAADVFNSEAYNKMRVRIEQNILMSIFKNNAPIKNISKMIDILNETPYNLRSLLFRSILTDILREIYSEAISSDNDTCYMSIDDAYDLETLISYACPTELKTVVNDDGTTSTESVDLIRNLIQKYLRCWIFFYASHAYALNYLSYDDASGNGNSLYSILANNSESLKEKRVVEYALSQIL